MRVDWVMARLALIVLGATGGAAFTAVAIGLGIGRDVAVLLVGAGIALGAGEVTSRRDARQQREIRGEEREHAQRRADADRLREHRLRKIRDTRDYIALADEWVQTSRAGTPSTPPPLLEDTDVAVIGDAELLKVFRLLVASRRRGVWDRGLASYTPGTFASIRAVLNAQELKVIRGEDPTFLTPKQVAAASPEIESDSFEVIQYEPFA